jgi:putative membrane protein insertion efficiency factor
MKQAVQFVLRCYQRVISPMLPHACRFVPTCSQYAIEAVECSGVVRGGLLAAARLLRCHPFARAGFDPVPPAIMKTGFRAPDSSPGNSRPLNGT